MIVALGVDRPNRHEHESGKYMELASRMDRRVTLHEGLAVELE